MTDLDPDTLYDVTVTAIYPDESESEDLMGDQRTCEKYKRTQICFGISLSPQGQRRTHKHTINIF